MDTIFMNSKNSKISDPRKLVLNLTDNINLTLIRLGGGGKTPSPPGIFCFITN